MAFSTVFPATAWVWQKIRGPAFRKLAFVVAFVIVLIGVGFRIEAVIFQLRVQRVLAGLREVEAGQTSRTELLHKLPILHQANASSTKCGAEGDTYEIEFQNLPTSNIGQRVYSFINGITPLYKLVYWFGYRPRRFDISVVVQHGVVSHIEYSLWVSPPENRYPGAIRVGVSSPISATRYVEAPMAEEQSPFVSIRRYFKWPKWDMHVSYSRDAPDRLKTLAFDLHLSCNWSLTGCRDAADLMPGAEQERIRIRNAATLRLRSPHPCPLEILPAKVRDANGIWLLQVKSVTPAAKSFLREPPQQGVYVDYELVQKIQLLEPEWSSGTLTEYWNPLTKYYYEENGEWHAIPNPAIEILTPGRTVLVFDGHGADASSSVCNTIAATPAALAIVKETRNRKDWDYT